MGRRAKNTKTDWTLAAFETLGAEGIDGVKVERIAKTLGATKGSFYWHFADRPALLAHMLDFWETEGTHNIIEQLQDAELPAAEKLKQLARVSSEAQTHGLDAIAVEGALRAWAGQDPMAAEKLKSTEAVRISYLEQLLLDIGHDQNAAETYARQLYLMLLGLYSISRHNPDAQNRDLFIAYADQLAQA